MKNQDVATTPKELYKMLCSIHRSADGWQLRAWVKNTLIHRAAVETYRLRFVSTPQQSNRWLNYRAEQAFYQRLAALKQGNG